MNGKRFDEIVEAQARKNAQEHIDKFVKDVKAVLTQFESSLLYAGDFWSQPLVVDLLTQLLTPYNQRVWPASIFEKEREAVQKSLLSTMNVMQEAIITADSFVPKISFAEKKQ